MSAGLNLETLNVEPTIFEPRLKFKLQLKFFKFGLWKHFYRLYVPMTKLGVKKIVFIIGLWETNFLQVVKLP